MLMDVCCFLVVLSIGLHFALHFLKTKAVSICCVFNPIAGTSSGQLLEGGCLDPDGMVA